MNFFHSFSSYSFSPPNQLQAGVDEYKHKRLKSHNSNHTEALCKKCRVRKVRGKCRNKECK